MGSWKIVLVDHTANRIVSREQLLPIAAALQQQVDNDLAPAWGVRADISVPAPGDTIPPDALPVNIVDSLPKAGGVHLNNKGQPYAEAVNGSDLSIAISHEVLEMLVDPWGNRFTRGPDMDPDFSGREVFYLVEVGDPCEVTSYPIDGVQVSDFALPSFYDPNGVFPFDRCKTLTGPLPQMVPRGCYISWIDPVDWKWHQQAPNEIFVTADATPGVNPREDRDAAFGGDDDHGNRHNIQEIYKAWPPDRSLPSLDRGQRERERELPVKEHQATLLELFKHLLDPFHGNAQA
jgi:hypothetical protein